MSYSNRNSTAHGIISIKNKSLNKFSLHNQSIKPYQTSKTPFATSFRGSFTIEASIVLPIFISFMMAIVFIFRMIQVEAGIQRALNNAARNAAVISASVDKSHDKKLLVATIGYADYEIKQLDVPTEYISGGLLGLDYAGSSCQDNYVELTCDYSLVFPNGLFGRIAVPVTQSAISRKWIGFDPREGEDADGEYVYVTESGQVYHLKRSCTYIDLSISKADYVDISSLRNLNGGKYDPCMTCGGIPGNGGAIYITDYGTAFHNSLSCSQLKRTVRKVRLEEALDQGLGVCSKCEKEE